MSAEAQKNRALFAEAMTRGGFRPYHKEWWHFTLANEPFPRYVFRFSGAVSAPSSHDDVAFVEMAPGSAKDTDVEVGHAVAGGLAEHIIGHRADVFDPELTGAGESGPEDEGERLIADGRCGRIGVDRREIDHVSFRS